jgi:integrase
MARNEKSDFTGSRLADLPDTEASPLVADYQEALESWFEMLAFKGLLQKESSKSQYEDMWQAFSHWAIAQKITLQDVSVDDLQKFIQARNDLLQATEETISPRYLLRFLRLIDRVMENRACTTGEPVNRAAKTIIENDHAIKYSDVSATNLEFLSWDDAQQLKLFLLKNADQQNRDIEKNDLRAWQEARNEAAVALQLAVGVTPAELRALKQDHAVFDKKMECFIFEIANLDLSLQRQVIANPWLNAVLMRWQAIRAALKIPGPWLFPSTKSGRSWGKVAQYLACLKVLGQAGLDHPKGGSFRLRHTYALQELYTKIAKKDDMDFAEHQAVLHELANQLGVFEAKVMTRYLEALKDWGE